MSYFIPVRVDVTQDQYPVIRLVDTFLMDPGQWPCERYHHENTEAWIERNARYLALQVLGDMEVASCQRKGASRFYGRLSNLQQQQPHHVMRESITSNLRPQLRAAYKQRCLVRMTPSSPSLSSQPVDTTDNTESESATKHDTSNPPLLVPIRLRMNIFGFRIHDDFNWDPKGPCTPLDMARSIVQDLRLPDDCINPIALDITEQCRGIAMTSEFIERDEGGPSQRENLTAAWELHQTTHVTNMAHLVALHDPTQVRR